jgi:hypothetical protein
LARLLKARRGLIPDMPRIRGAINKDKLAELLAFLDVKKSIGRLNDRDHNSLYCASIFLYACALRVFQLRSLTKDSFSFSYDVRNPDVIHGWVTVPRKGGKGVQKETKQIRPDFVPFIMKFLDERQDLTKDVFLFSEVGLY